MSYTCRSVTQKYCARFGLLAVELGFVTESQLREGLRCQQDEDEAGRSHRLLGQIFFDHGWMSSQQIEKVMTEVMRRMRREAA